jgi:hypothetical protein
MNYNILYLTGILLTFLVGIANLVVSLKNNKKTTFINSITNSRIKYIQEIRNYIADFCGSIYSYNSRRNELPPDQLLALHKQADKTKYLIRLYLNPEDKYWDDKILKLLDEILLLTDKDPNSKIEELIIITQYLLKLEWEGAKLESERGILNKIEKQELYSTYEELHKSYLINNKDEKA